jgi:hypothetical protein
MQNFIIGLCVGAFLVVMVVCPQWWTTAPVAAQQFYPANPPGLPPTPQQQWNDQRTQLLFQQFMQQQLQNGLHHDPC